ncbi:MAG: protein translocase subunit SecF [bacterium]
MAENKVVILQPMRYRILYLALSAAVIIPGSLSLIKNGLKLGIDFKGGSTIIWQMDNIDETKIRGQFQEKKVSINEYTQQDKQVSIQTDQLDSKIYQSLKTSLSTPSAIKELSFETVGPSLGAELLKKTITGLALAASLILCYVAYRFKSLKYGVSAILAMLHDLLVVLGVFSLIGKFWGVQIDTLFVTALLTILSFSVHDTIVVYDRIRELKKKHSYLDFEEVVNRAVVETMGRSINNSMTIIFMLLTMYLLGGETTKWFIFALLIGTISGTYSSTFTAAPLIVLWDKWERKMKAR